MSSTDKCYFPNGDEYTTGQPCNSTADGTVSVCCELSSSVCTTSGLCFGSAGYLYRGGCTDRSWRSPQCGEQCISTRMDNFANVYFCEPGVFDAPRTVCCGGDTNCCASNFSLNPGVPFFPTFQLEDSASTTSSASSKPTGSSSSSSASSSPSCAANSNGTAVCPAVIDGPSASVVGGAVGGSMAALLLVTLVFFFLRERSWKRQTAGANGPRNAAEMAAQEYPPGTQQQYPAQLYNGQQYNGQPYSAYPPSQQTSNPEDWRWKNLPAYSSDTSSPNGAQELPPHRNMGVNELDGRTMGQHE